MGVFGLKQPINIAYPNFSQGWAIVWNTSNNNCRIRLNFTRSQQIRAAQLDRSTQYGIEDESKRPLFWHPGGHLTEDCFASRHELEFARPTNPNEIVIA